MANDLRKIFISYRRADARADAGRLYDRLDMRYPGRVFRDVGSLEPGVEWQDAIEDVLASTDVFIAVIGPGWLRGADGKRRIDDPADAVHKELSIALRNGARVFPVLVGDARLPGEAELPPDLRPLVRHNALELSEQDFDAGLDKLIKAIERTPGWSSSGGTRRVGALVSAVAVLAVAAALAATYMARQRSRTTAAPPAAAEAIKDQPGRPAPVEPPASATSGRTSGAAVTTSVQPMIVPAGQVAPSVGQVTLNWSGANAAAWQVLDVTRRKTLRYASVGAGASETLDIAPGDYVVALGNLPEFEPVPVTVVAGQATSVAIAAGQITFTWNGANAAAWQVLDASGRKTLRYASAGPGGNETLDIAPGKYVVALGSYPEFEPIPVTVAAGAASRVGPEVGQITFTWTGANAVAWQVLDASRRKTLRYASAGPGQTETLDIAPGSYTVQLGNMPEIAPAAITVTAGQARPVTLPAPPRR